MSDLQQQPKSDIVICATRRNGVIEYLEPATATVEQVRNFWETGDYLGKFGIVRNGKFVTVSFFDYRRPNGETTSASDADKQEIMTYARQFAKIWAEDLAVGYLEIAAQILDAQGRSKN